VFKADGILLGILILLKFSFSLKISNCQIFLEEGSLKIETSKPAMVRLACQKGGEKPV
jgi:hypothetical protein